MLLQIATILPREQQGILACCNPIPPLVRQQLNEIHMIVLKAREMPLEKVSAVRKSVAPEAQESIEYDLSMHDRLDRDHGVEMSVDWTKPEEAPPKKRKSRAPKQLSPLADFLCRKPKQNAFEKAIEEAIGKAIDSFASPYERVSFMYF